MVQKGTAGTILCNPLSARRLRLLVGAISTGALLAGVACSGGSTDERFPISVTDKQVDAGAALYAVNCSSCHGEPGVSRPPVATAPPHDGEGHTWHHADRLLFEWILDRPPLAEIMPAFRDTLTEGEVISILAYIKSTWPADIQDFQRRGSEQYEAQIRESS